MASSSPRIDLSSIDSIATATFASARRGYDQDEVRNALRALAGEIARGRDELARLKVELASRPHASGQVDEASVAAALGEEAAHVLTAAHSAAVQMRTRAEEASARLLREASEEAARVREAAELDAAHRRREAADAATAEVEAAKSEGRQMVMEARAVRERMLADLARRKEAARQQVDLVVEAHERVMRALGTAREHMDDAAHGLAAALPELHRHDVDDTQPVPVVAGATRSALEMYDAALDESESDITAPSAGFHLGEMPVASSPTTVASVVGADDLRADHGDHPSTGGPAASPRRLTLVVSDTDTTADEVPEPTSDESPEPTADESPDTTADESAEPTADDSSQVAENERSDEVTSATDEDVAEAGSDEVEPTTGGTGPAPAPSEADLLDGGEVAWIDDDVDGRDSRSDLSGPSTDDLFARIRAGRADAVAQAHEVLGRGPEPDSAEPRTADARSSKRVTADRAERAAGSVALLENDEPVRPEPADPDAARRAIEARADILDPIVAKAGRHLKRTLADEQNEVLDRLRRGPGVPAIELLLGDASSHTIRYRDAIADDLAAAAKAGAKALGGTGAGSAAIVRVLADDITAEFVTPLRHRLHDAVAEAGGDTEAATDRLRAAYREWKVQRLDDVVAHLLRVAYGRGGFASLAPGTPVCWAVDPSAAPCVDGDDNVLGGAVPAGTAFPTGHLHAPAYPGCRCVLVSAHR